MDIHGTSSAAAMGALPCFKAAWHRHNASGYAFILPALLVILCLVGYPFVMAIYLSLTDAWVGTEGKFVGFRNYSDLVLIGPSGCGKSTTLNLIAGLEEASEGRIFIGERPVNQLHPKDRDIAMVFQNYALYPHMNVYANMAFGLSMRGYSKTVIDRRIREAAEILGIGDLLLRKPKALSGGQRQRVAVGRAIVRKPAVFLFDEPLSNLDAKLRVQMRAELSKLHQRLNTTIVYVTHDQIEAMTMATRIVLLKDGVCQQIGRPLELYTRPVNTFTAGFIGTPPMNLVPARVEAPGGQVTLAGECFRLPIPVRLRPAYEGLKSREVIFGIRPEHLRGMRENDLPAGAKLKKIGKPVGIQLGHSLDGNGAMLALMWGYGAGITAKDGKTITINSPETIKAVEFVKTLYTDAMDPEVISWDDAANNRAVLAGTCSMAFNSPSIYKAAKSKDIRVPETDKPLADAIDHIRSASSGRSESMSTPSAIPDR